MGAGHDALQTQEAIMTENEIRNAFHDDSEFNTADKTKSELLRRTTAGFGGHTSPAQGQKLAQGSV